VVGAGSAPRLRFRPTRADDLGECAALLPAWLPVAMPDVQSLWRRLMQQPAAMSTVMEDLARPAGRRIQGWGCGLVLPRDWVLRLGLDGDAPRPRAPVVPQVYAGLLDGSLVLPDDRELGALNASGRVQFLNLHYVQHASDLSDDYALAVLNVANEAFRVAASGWRLQAMHFESSARDAPMFASAGFPVVPYAERGPWDHAPDAWRPLFLGVTREQARASLPGTSVRHAFEHQPPRFRLSASQRRLLWHALFDESDEHLMRVLDVSVHGLKKLWRGIYERIEDAEPDFFGDHAGDDEGRRGPEKRRQVLAYVRQRPEERRPWHET
jgi:hypothetical protein